MAMFTNDFLEFLNLDISILDFFLVGMFVVYIFRSGSWWSGPGFQLAVALMLNYLGHGMVRGWTWFWRFSNQHNLFGVNLLDSIPILHVGLVIITVSVFLVGRQISSMINMWIWLLLILVSGGISAFVAWGL